MVRDTYSEESRMDLTVAIAQRASEFSTFSVATCRDLAGRRLDRRLTLVPYAIMILF